MNLIQLEKFLIRYGPVKKISSKRLAVLTEGNRSSLLEKISDEIPGAVYDRNPTSGSSVGFVRADGFSLFVKPKSKQGARSAGIENEVIVINSINNIIKENAGMTIDVRFKSRKGQTQTIRNVTHCKEMGRDTSGRKKADIILETSKLEYPISIKKDNAEIWESADSYYGMKAAKHISNLLEDNKIKLVPMGVVYKVEPNFAIKATKKETIEVVFGSDLLRGRRGSVIQRTFSSSDFKMDYNKNLLTIKVSSIIRKPEDVKGNHTVWFLVRNDRTRKTIKDFPGIRVLAAYESRINSNVLRVKG
jgi:hypothetical protein